MVMDGVKEEGFGKQDDRRNQGEPGDEPLQ